MPAFDELREQLQQARAHAAATEDGRAAALDRMRLAQRRLERLGRSAPAAAADATGAAAAHAAAVAEERSALGAALADHRAALATAEEERLRAREALRDAIRDFEPVADPRRNVGELDDTTPILLLPVRLETRFKTVASSTGGERSELWLRIYPDDCSIDTFEPALSDSEVDSARRYWVERLAAAGVEDEQRAAWRGLVASHGAGRARWLIERYRPQPANPGDEPTKPRREDVMLVVAAETPLDPAAAAAAADYWRAVWRADGDAAEVEAATAALVAAVGEEAANEIVAYYRPDNLSRTPPAPHTRDEVNVDVAFLALPAEGTFERREASWSRPPTAALMPDRFVFLGYRGGGEPVVHLGAPVATPLVVGPDPIAPDGEQLHAEEDGELFVPAVMRWMVDFDEAVAAGMGMRIPLDTDAAAGGFDRVLVVGLRLSDDEAGSADALATLLAHHRHGPAGLEFVPQGTPTNNTEGHDAGEDADDDPDASFDDLAAEPLFTHETDWLDKRDGQWLAEYLGVDPATFSHVHHADGRDQADARAMNTLLWPATLGYWMDTMMAPMFDRDTVEQTRLFFTRFVSGRGAVPALRIADQPYGILPATPFSRMRWPQPTEVKRLAAAAGPSATLAAAGGGFLAALHDLLQRADADWRDMAGDVSHTGSDGDAHQILLDVIGLHPTSEEYAQRYAESVESLFNRLNLSGLGVLVAALVVGGIIQQGTDLLGRLGYNGDAPDILGKLFLGSHNLLKGPLVDEAPLSETAPLPAATTDGHNYLRWLSDAAATSLDALYRQQGFEGDRPAALLYLLVRHALQLGYDDAGLRLYESAGLLAGPALLQARKEPPFLHIAERAEQSESRYTRLYATEPAITGSAGTRVADFIAASLPSLAAAGRLRQQLRALERLVDAPTARLERVLAEHVDCASYRLDAWLLGLVHYQLALMRGILPGQRPAPGAVAAPVAVEAPRQGIHLGAYAWLEDVRPRSSAPEPVEPASLPGDLAEVFDAAATTELPLERDPDNKGWIHAPSLNQAVAAAVLRSAYASDASPDNPETLAVNLTSERARRALALLEGLQGGQSLGALLGYQLERGLHDRYSLAEVDRFIYPLRKAFPLAGDRMASTRTDPDEPITSVEARNVVDGLALAEHVAETGQRTYPFGLELPAPDDAAQQAALDAEVERLLDSHDAVSDLALAEGVYQAVLGNYDRVASTYDAYAKGEAAPEPQVVRTPTAGPSILQRVALHLESGLDPAVSPIHGIGVTPRAHVEPALNRWLAGMLPDLERVACVATYRAAATGAATDVEVTLADLELQPADVLHLLREESDAALAELDERVVRRVVDTQPVRPDVQVTVRYMDTIAASFPVFQVLPLVRALRRLVGAGRPLVASDLELAGEAAEGDDADVSLDAQRIVGVQMMLGDLRGDARDLRDDLDGLTAALDADLEGNLDGLVAGVEGHVHAAVALLARAAAFGLPQSGWAFAYAFRQRVAARLRERAAALVDRWDGRLADVDALLAEEAALPADATDEERFVLLADAERLVSTVRTSPPPPLAAFRAQLATARGEMDTRRDGFAVLAASTDTSVSQLLAAAHAAADGPPPVTALDADGFPLDSEIGEAAGFVGDTAAVLGVVIDECAVRLDAAQQHLDEYDAAAEATARVAALTAAARALLGEDVLVIPEFAVTPEHRAELAAAHAVSADGTLLSYLEADAGMDLPVDTWLYGAARVREPLRALEQVIMLTGALEAAGGEPELVPLQLPARPDDRWLALDIPPDYELDAEHLCYTAHFAAPLDPSGRQCGLLLDEWSEVIPDREVTTGVAFHYDRPNAEAPQAMLLVTPSAFRGAWEWDDIVDALHETLDLAKRRAVEPVHLDRSAYAPFLPATVMAVTVAQLSISVDLALNNQVHLFTEGS